MSCSNISFLSSCKTAPCYSASLVPLYTPRHYYCTGLDLNKYCPTHNGTHVHTHNIVFFIKPKTTFTIILVRFFSHTHRVFFDLIQL